MTEPRLTKFCHACGETIAARAELCPHCGVRQPGMGTNGPDRITAALCAIFLGGIGAHKFYLRRPLLGLLYLIFVWSGIPTLVGIVEGLVYLLRGEEKFAEKYAAD